MKGEIQYIDCGSSIWMTKEDWETLKIWFKSTKGGQELEEYNKVSAKKIRSRMKKSGVAGK